MFYLINFESKVYLSLVTMETKLVGRNLHQHILTSLYTDRSLGDTVLRVEGRDYICHAAMLAATSSLFRRALQDPQVHHIIMNMMHYA